LAGLSQGNQTSDAAVSDTDGDGLAQFPFGQVARWLVEGEIVPFIGAGASRIGGAPERQLPDGPGLAAELAAAMAGAFPADPGSDLPKVAQYYEYSVFDRSALYELLYSRFEDQQRSVSPPPTAGLLATMPRDSKPLFMITTNYDSMIERAFRKAQKPICVMTQNMRDPENGVSAIHLILPDGTQRIERSNEFQWKDDEFFPPDCAYLYKMHGSVHSKNPSGQDDIIITEDDYIDFITNSGGNSSPYFPPTSLNAAFKIRRFLFLGYSLSDWNFRAFLRVLEVRNALSGQARRRHWAIQRAPSRLEVDLWAHRNVSLYDGDLLDFLRRLQAQWQIEAEQR
jgi:hypothetical protein